MTLKTHRSHMIFFVQNPIFTKPQFFFTYIWIFAAKLKGIFERFIQKITKFDSFASEKLFKKLLVSNCQQNNDFILTNFLNEKNVTLQRFVSYLKLFWTKIFGLEQCEQPTQCLKNPKKSRWKWRNFIKINKWDF